MVVPRGLLMKYPVKIVIGLAGGVGANLDSVYNEIKHQFNGKNFKVKRIKVSDFFKEIKFNKKEDKSFFEKHKCKSIDINSSDGLKKLNAKMSCGSAIRFLSDDNSVLARYAISEIYIETFENKTADTEEVKHVYVIDQVKRVEEFKLLRKTYGRSFFMIGVFHDEQKRMERLSKDIKDFKSRKELIDRDKNEGLIKHDREEKDSGQALSKVFPQSHLFVDAGDIDKMKAQIIRFVQMLFGYPFNTPTTEESCMYLAKGVSARSADLGRQVGGVVADERGNILAVGYNDVPRVGGGFHVAGDVPDLRDFQLRYNSNRKEIIDLKDELMKSLNKKCSEKIKSRNALDDLIEYGRSVHAEEAVICDAAVRGISLKGTTLYCTTFPCHLCVKHIIAVGIKRVVYIDPYPKSKVKELFEHSVSLNQEFYESGKVVFEPFIGISPRRFIHFFIRDSDQKLTDEKGYLKEINEMSLMSHLKSRNASVFFIREYASMLKSKEIFDNKPLKLNKIHKKIKNLIEVVLRIENEKLKDLATHQDCYTEEYKPKNDPNE